MKLSSISIEEKEKRNHIEIMVYHDYFFRDGSRTYAEHITTKIIIKKPTKKEIIKKTNKI